MNISATSSQSSSMTTVMQNMGLTDQTGLIAASLLANASGCKCEEENDSNSALMLMALMAGSSTLTTSASVSSSQVTSAYSDSPEQPSQLNVEA